MADLRKFETVKEMVEQGRITVRAELRHANFRQGYEPSTNPAENYYAVYGNAADIHELDGHNCLAATNRPRTVLPDGRTKAYLGNLEGGQAASLCSAPPGPPAEFALHKPGAPVHAIGLYHTGYPIEAATNDTLSYLVVSAANRREFKTAVERLTNSAEPNHIQMQHIGRDSGEFLVLPIRRSMAEAIHRAHPQAIEITGDDMARQPFSIAGMQHIVARLHDDVRFAMPAARSAPAPKVAATVSEPEPTETIAPRPLKDWLAALAPHVVGFEQHEQIGGGASMRVLLRIDHGVRQLCDHMNNDALCPDRNGFHMPSFSGNMGSQIIVGINNATYDTLKAHLPEVPVTHHVQELQPSLLKYMPVQIHGRTHSRFNITGLCLARTEEGGTVQNWLAITAPHIKRAEMMATSLGFGADRQHPITDGTEQPAILLVPVTPSVTESLIRGSKQPVPHEETPYASFQDMQADLREHVGERTLLTDLVADEPPRKFVLQPAKPEPKRAEAEIRHDAAHVLFTQLNANQRLWMHYARHQPGKRNKVAQEVVCLGIRMQSERTKDVENKAKQFEDALRATGFTDLPGREFRYVGSTGEGSAKHHIYRLKLKPQDIEAWNQASHDDKHWPALKEGETTRHLIPLTEDQVRKRFERFLQNNPARERPEETAWRRLSVLANEGAIRCVQVRFTADDLRHIGAPLEQQLEVIDAAAAVRHTLRQQREEWQKNGLPMHLDQVDDDLGKLDQQMRHVSDASQVMHDLVASITQGRKDYFQWLSRHPRNEDGSITLQCIVMPDPRPATLQHLRQAEHFSVEQQKGTLLPQKVPYTYDRILEGNKLLHITPITPAFVSQLAAHDGYLETISDQPVLLSDLNAHLRTVYGKSAAEQPVYDNHAVTNDIELAHQRKARKLLIEDHFPRCRNMILYGQLRADNNLANLGDRPAHDHIGAQHALMLHVDARRQWTQHAKPMLEEMQRAALLDARKSYVMPLGAVDPAVIIAEVEQLDTQEKELSNIVYAARQMQDDPHDEFNYRLWDNSLKQFFRDASDMSDTMQRLAAELRNAPNATEATQHLLARSAGISDRLRALRSQRVDVEETYDQALEIARSQGMMRQEREPLFYIRGEEHGYTLNALNARVTKHFSGHGTEPLDIVTYLAPEGPHRGDLSNEHLIRQLKSAPPDLGGASTAWTTRIVGRRRAECPTNVTLDGFYTEADKIFAGSLGR